MQVMRHNTARAKAINAAIRRAKAAFDEECIITGQAFPDGAHVYPRSTYPELAACEFNVVPLTRECHRYMDSLPAVAGRIEFLQRHCAPEHFGKLTERMGKLEEIKDEKEKI